MWTFGTVWNVGRQRQEEELCIFFPEVLINVAAREAFKWLVKVLSTWNDHLARKWWVEVVCSFEQVQLKHCERVAERHNFHASAFYRSAEVCNKQNKEAEMLPKRSQVYEIRGFNNGGSSQVGTSRSTSTSNSTVHSNSFNFSRSSITSIPTNKAILAPVVRRSLRSSKQPKMGVPVMTSTPAPRTFKPTGILIKSARKVLLKVLKGISSIDLL